MSFGFPQNWVMGVILGGSFVHLSGCAHHRDVRPSVSGTHLVVTKGEDEENAYQNAKEQAEHFCDQSDKMPYVVSEDTKFVGLGSENEHKRNKKIAKAAKYGGLMGAFFMPTGGLRSASGVATTAGFAGDAYLGAEYRITMKFRCQK